MMADGRFSLLLPLVVAICLARSATGRPAPHACQASLALTGTVYGTASPVCIA